MHIKYCQLDEAMHRGAVPAARGCGVVGTGMRMAGRKIWLPECLLQVINYSPIKEDKQTDAWDSLTHGECFILLNGARKPHSTSKHSTVSLKVIFLL